MKETKTGRTVNVGIRLRPDEFEAFRREASRRKWTVSQVMRERALKGLDLAAVSAGDGEKKAVGA